MSFQASLPFPSPFKTALNNPRVILAVLLMIIIAEAMLILQLYAVIDDLSRRPRYTLYVNNPHMETPPADQAEGVPNDQTAWES